LKFLTSNTHVIYRTLTFHATIIIGSPREFSSVGRDNAYYKQGPGFKHQLPQKKTIIIGNKILFKFEDNKQILF